MIRMACFLCDLDSESLSTEIQLPEDVAFKEVLFTTSCAVMKECLTKNKHYSHVKRAEILSMVQIVKERLQVPEIKSKVLNLLTELSFIQPSKPKLVLKEASPVHDDLSDIEADLLTTHDDFKVLDELPAVYDLPVPTNDLPDSMDSLPVVKDDLPVSPIDLPVNMDDLQVATNDLPMATEYLSPVKEDVEYPDFSDLDDDFPDNTDTLFDLEDNDEKLPDVPIEALATKERTAADFDIKDEMEILEEIQVLISPIEEALLKKHGLKKKCIVKLERCDVKPKNAKGLKKPKRSKKKWAHCKKGKYTNKRPDSEKSTDLDDQNSLETPTPRIRKRNVGYVYCSDGESQSVDTKITTFLDVENIITEDLDEDNSVKRPIRSSRKRKQSLPLSYSDEEDEERTPFGSIPKNKNRKQRKQSPTFSPPDSASNHSSEGEHDANEDEEDDLPEPKQKRWPASGPIGTNYIFNSVREEEAYIATGKWSRCKECKLIVKNARLVKHLKVEHDIDYLWQCQECPKTFSSFTQYGWHKRSSHMQWPACHRCGQRFQKMKRHEETCKLTEGIYIMRKVWERTCECSEKFNCIDEFYTHMSTIPHKSPAICPSRYCNTELFSATEERNHIKTVHSTNKHTVSVVYDCSLCEKKSIGSRGMLYYHQLIDHGKPIPCLAKDCTKEGEEKLSFSTLELYQEHQKGNHWIGKSWENNTFNYQKCHLCEFVACKPRDLTNHKKIAHGILDVEVCYKCGQVFSKATVKHVENCNGSGKFFQKNRLETYTCDKCPEMTPISEPLLAIHSMEVHNEPYYKCFDCSEHFATIFLRSAHSTETHFIPQNEKHICPYCGKEVLRNNYRKHCRKCKISSQKPHKKVNSGFSARLYERFPDAFVTHPEDPLKCSFEGCKYRSRWNIPARTRGHYMMHHAMVTCDKCGESRKASCIDLHYDRIHQIKTAENNLFPCDQCDLSFGLQAYLQNHKEKDHIKEATYGCNICSKMFISRKKLSAHKYTNHKEYSCKPCGYSSKKIAEYKQHMLDVHGETKLKPFKGGIEQTRIFK